MRAVVLALALGACAASNGSGSQFSSDAAPMGEGRWLVTCYTFASACTQRAAALCPSGFDVAQVDPQTVRTGAIGPSGGGFGQRTDYHMQVTCKT